MKSMKWITAVFTLVLVALVGGIIFRLAGWRTLRVLGAPLPENAHSVRFAIHYVEPGNPWYKAITPSSSSASARATLCAWPIHRWGRNSGM